MELLIQAFLLGLVGGAVPGPILTGTFTEILRSNFVKGLRVIFLALVVETIGTLLTIYVFYQLGLSKLVIQLISVLGGLVLFWLAYQVWNIKKINTESKDVITPWRIIILTALNSGYWIFWITVGIPKALSLNDILIGGKFIFLIIFEIAWLAMTTLLAFIFFKFRPILERKNLVNVTFKILSAVLVILGIRTLISNLI
ncbi:MAG: LysE family transporter [Candidatus Paceibacterota bacterium]|jgi:threonine/homoserine/homoserine lactone efflux protein